MDQLGHTDPGFTLRIFVTGCAATKLPGPTSRRSWGFSTRVVRTFKIGFVSTGERVGLSLQSELKRRRIDEALAVEAARWLAADGLLADSASRPGLPVRRLLPAAERHQALSNALPKRTDDGSSHAPAE